MTAAPRITRLRALAEELDRLPASAERNSLLYAIRARIVALDTQAEFRANRWSGPVDTTDSLAPLLLER
jgi:hypothetical protein